MWHMWQGDVLQVTLANQIADGKLDSGKAEASAVAGLVSLWPVLGPQALSEQWCLASLMLLLLLH